MEKFIKKWLPIILVVVMIVPLLVTNLFAADYVMTVDTIPEPWSSTIFDLPNATRIDIGKGFTPTEDRYGDRLLVGYNKSKSEDYSVFYENAARMGNQSYDLKIYYWCNNHNGYAARVGYGFYDGITSRVNTIECQNGTSSFDSSVDNIFDIEMHFFKHGETVEDPNYKGILWWQDLDTDEGILPISGVQDCYLFPNSTVEKRADGWYRGTQISEEIEEQTRLAACVSTNSGIVHMKYDCNYGYGTNYGQLVNNVTYKISSISDYNPGTIITTEPVVRYGEYNIINPQENLPNYYFYGWYEDEACTKPINYIQMINSDKTIYCKYVEKPKIITEVVNGTITPSIEGINKGENRAVTYSPNPNHMLKSITVDGKNQDLESFKNEYLFTNITADHHIKVVYEPIPNKEITITKVWIDWDNKYKTRPKSLDIDILNAGNLVKTETLSASNAISEKSNIWQKTISVPMYDQNKNIINYSIQEKLTPYIQLNYKEPIYNQETLTVQNKAFFSSVKNEIPEYQITVHKNIVNKNNQVANDEDFMKIKLNSKDTFEFPITLKAYTREIINDNQQPVYEKYGDLSGTIYKGIVTNKGDLVFNNIPAGKYEIAELPSRYFNFVDFEEVSASSGVTFSKVDDKYIIILPGLTGENENLKLNVINKINTNRYYYETNTKENMFKKQ